MVVRKIWSENHGGAVEILVSIINALAGRPVLCSVNTTSSRVRVLPVPLKTSRYTGARGLCHSDRYLYLIRQELSGFSKPALFVFDRSSFRLLNEHVFQSTGDIHSICRSGEALYAASTGTDEVIRLEMRGPEVVSESVIWRPEPDGPRSDEHHLNGVCCWRGDLLVSGFGKKSGPQWSSALDGFIFNITRREQVVGGLYNPHSVVPFETTIAYCESRTGEVRVHNDFRRLKLPAYTRGLCVADNKVFVGTSVSRRVSKSTGVISAAPSPEMEAARCTVTRLSLDTFTVEDTIDLSSYGTEVYDLLPVEMAESWPEVSLDQFAQAGVLWEDSVRRAKEEIARVVPPGEAFVLIDTYTLRNGEAWVDRRCIDFLQRNGEYWMPPDDAGRIEHLRQFRSEGTSFLVFAWPSYWWFSEYRVFTEYLRSTYPRTLENERVVIFDLRQEKGAEVNV